MPEGSCGYGGRTPGWIDANAVRLPARLLLATSKAAMWQVAFGTFAGTSRRMPEALAFRWVYR